MNMKCPNKTLPEWKELVEAVGENSAYYLWDLNNGYGLDKAPNGEPSKLFSDLLSHYNGDRNAAIAAKAKVYSEAFKNWFGDWLNPSFSLKSGNIVFGHPAIGKTYSVLHGTHSNEFIDWDDEYNQKRDEWIEEHSGTKKGTPEYKKARNNYLIYPENHPEYVEFVTKEWNRVKNKARLENKILIASPHNLLKMFPKDFTYIIDLEQSDFIDRNMNRGGDETSSRLWKEGIDSTIRNTLNIPRIVLKRGLYFEDFLNSSGSVSKIVDENGEPLIVYHHANDLFSEFSVLFDNYFSTVKGGTKKALFFTGTLNPASGTVLDRPYKMPVFLNAKVVIEKIGTKDQLREQGEDFVTTINRAAEEADAAIFHRIDDNQETDLEIFVINNPNNVKSIDNQGTFSTLNNNIYNLEDIEGIENMTTSLSPERVEKVSNYMIAKLTLKTQAYRPRSTKYLPDLILDLSLDLFGVLPSTTVDIKDSKYLDEILFFIYNTLYSRVMDSIDETRASLRNYKELSEVQVKNAVRSYLYDDSKLLSDYDISTRNILTSLLPTKVLKRDKKSIGYYKHMLVSSEPNKLNAGIKTVVHNNRLGKFKLRARLSKLQTVLDTLNIVPGSRKMMFDKFVSEYLRYLVYDSTPKKSSGMFSGFTELVNSIELLEKYYNSPYETNQIFSLKQIQEGTNAKDALLAIISNSNNSLAVLLAKNLLPYVSEETKISFLGVKDGKLSVGGTFYHGTNNIEIFTFSNLFQRHPEFSVIHEIVHSLSVLYISDNPFVYKNLLEIIDFLKSNSLEEWYAFTDPYELVAEFLSNPNFREFTKTVLVKGESINIFLRILNAILGWLRPDNRLTVFDYLDEVANNIIESLYSNISINDESSQNVPLTFNIADTIPQDLLNLINNTYDRIQKGLKDRLKSVKRYSTKNPRLWNQLSTVISLLANSEAELGILLFLLHISDTINDAIKFLQKPIDEINAKQIRQLSLDYVGFYKPLLDDIIYLFDTTDIFKDLPNYAELQRNALRLSTEMDLVYNRFVHLLKAKGISELVSYLQSNNVPLSYIDKTLEWLNNPTNDISIFLNWFGMASNSNSMVTQAIAKMLNDTMNLTLRETMSKGIELVKLALAAKEKYGVDVLKLLYEKLNDGTYSGYRVRPINYGLYKKDKQLYLDKLANKLGITKDKEGHYNLPNDEAIQKKWFDGINKFYSERVNRRFTSEYYTTRNRMLSVKTRDAIDEILDYIDSIVSRVTIDGVLHDELLTQSEYQLLLTLRRLKQLLANEYNLDGSIKTGDDLIIADELSAFNEEVNKNVKREVDWDSYNRDHKKIVDQYGKDDPRTKLWEARNTIERYTDEFYERLDRLNDVEQSELYDDLVYKRRQLRQLFKDPETKLIKAGDLTGELKTMLLQLDKDIAASRYIEQRNPDELEDSFKKFAEVVYTDEYYRDYREAHDAGTTLFLQWYEANHYEDAYGRMRPASYYTKLKPKDEVADKYTETVPTGRYTKIDTTSNWYNPDYDNNGPAILPKKKYYDNSKAYNEVMSKPEVKALYEAIVDTMNQANSYIPFLNMADDGRMSLMPARFAQVWARMTGITDRLKYAIDEVVTTLADDFDYVEEFATMPNGDPIKVIPTRFILMLENPNTISTDAVTATIAYYNMAVNFKNMLEQLDNIELMLGLLKGITIRNKKGTVQSGNSNLYKLAQLLVDRLMYGRNMNLVTANILGKEINITKMATLLLSQIRKVNLSGNIWSIATSFFTDSTYTTLEAKLGRYFDKEDLLFAVKEYARRLPNIMENIGNPVPNDKLSYLMLLNLVVRDNREVFDRIDLSLVLRSINNNFWYFGYTQSDYLVKSHTLMSVYHNYRLVDGKFMSKAEFINKYYPSDKKAGEAAFKLLEITAFDAYNEDGTVKEEYKSKITTKLMNDIKNRIDVLSRRIDGTLREVDKALIHANFLGQYVIMHKNFMIQGLHDRFKKKQFNLDTLMEEDGYYRSMARFLRNVIGNRHFGLTQLLADYNLLQEYELYAIRRVLHEMALFTSATLLALSLAALVDGDDDYDNWLMQSLTYLALRSAFEFRTMYNPMEFFSLIKSPTAAFTWFDNASAFINLFNPFSYIGSGGPFAIIDRGVYEGMPRILRNIIKVTPIRSIIEAGDPESKRSYLLNQLMSF